MRGKRRQGFSLELSLAWTCGDVHGKLTCASVESDDLDDMVLSAKVLTPDAGRAKQETAALSAARAMGAAVAGVMEKFSEELRQK